MASILRMQGKRGACDPPRGQVAAGVGMDRKPRRTHGFWSIPTPACAGMGTGDCRSRGGLDLADQVQRRLQRSEEHTSELQSLMRISYAVFCLKKKQYNNTPQSHCN